MILFTKVLQTLIYNLVLYGRKRKVQNETPRNYNYLQNMNLPSTGRRKTALELLQT